MDLLIFFLSNKKNENFELIVAPTWVIIITLSYIPVKY